LDSRTFSPACVAFVLSTPCLTTTHTGPLPCSRSGGWPAQFQMAYSNLTKAELWEGMAANSKAIADIARYQLGMAKGRIDPAMQAKLIRSDLKTLAKLQREHDAYFVELQRRNSQKRSRRKIKKGY
jgi:hypothetical protein